MFESGQLIQASISDLLSAGMGWPGLKTGRLSLSHLQRSAIP